MDRRRFIEESVSGAAGIGVATLPRTTFGSRGFGATSRFADHVSGDDARFST